MMAEGRSDDELERLDISLGMVTNPEEEALGGAAAHQEAAASRSMTRTPRSAGTGGEDLGWMGE